MIDPKKLKAGDVLTMRIMFDDLLPGDKVHVLYCNEKARRIRDQGGRIKVQSEWGGQYGLHDFAFIELSQHHKHMEDVAAEAERIERSRINRPSWYWRWKLGLVGAAGGEF